MQAGDRQDLIGVLFEAVGCPFQSHGLPADRHMSRVRARWMRPFAALFTVRTQIGCGFKKKIEASGASGGRSQPATWGTCPVVGDFDKQSHFPSMAAGAGGDIDAR
jgi:hypothetical protein